MELFVKMQAINTIAARLFGIGLATVGFGVGAFAADVVTTIKLHQSPPDLTTVDLGQEGRSVGDVLGFEAKLQEDNKVVATINGYNVIMDVAGSGEKLEDRFSHIVFDFGNGSTIVIAGRSAYTPSTLEIVDKVEQPRAIVGGTGKYIGARGQVTTSRNPDGSYNHIIELVD
jgi:hypothetical protein